MNGERAASWALAAALAGRLGAGVKLFETHPGNGHYDCLTLVSSEGVRFDLNRNGSNHVQVGADWLPGRVPVWADLAAGRRSVASEVDVLLQRVRVDGVRPSGTGAIGFLAEVARQTALFDVDWDILCLWEDSSGQHGSSLRREYLAPFGASLDRRLDERDYFEVWVVVSGDDPLLAVDLRSDEAVGRDGTRTSLLGAGSRSRLVEKLLGRRLSTTVSERPAQRPGLGLPVVLSQFNRKERFFLVTDAVGAGEGADTELHGASLPLSQDFRDRLAQALGDDAIEVPAHAWASFDFHLDWLHAAVQWTAGATWPGQSDGFPTRQVEGVDVVAGNQEDIDLVVSWVDGSGITYLVLVEAKAYSSWSTKQASSKIPRLRAILDVADQVPGLRPFLVLTSPRPPQKFATQDWPSWAMVGGEVRHMVLPTPGERVSVTRCTPEGQPSASGQEWRITGP